MKAACPRRLPTASGDDLTETDDPFKVAMRQIAGVFAQMEKARLVAKLKAARDRKRATRVKVEGRKSIAETKPEVVEQARKLARARPKGGKRSLREIADELAREGHVTQTGKPYGPAAVAAMLDPDYRKFQNAPGVSRVA